MHLPVPNLALREVGASLLATAESVGPIRVLQLLIAPSPISSKAMIGPLDMNCIRPLQNIID